MARLSGMQKDVLSLYRRADDTSFLRMVRTKPPPARAHFLLMVRHAFHTNARAVAVRDVNTVEHLLRRGRRQLAVYADAGVRDCAVSDAMRAWERDVYSRRGATT